MNIKQRQIKKYIYFKNLNVVSHALQTLLEEDGKEKYQAL